MKKGSGLVPLSRITEYLASLPDYVPTDRWAVIGCQLLQYSAVIGPRQV